MTVATALRRSVPVVSTWTPASLSPYLWLDASQESYNDGDAVGTWTDRSGNTRHFVSTGTKRPTYKTGVIGSAPALRWDGSNDNMNSNAAINPGATQVTAWWVTNSANFFMEQSGDYRFNYAWIAYCEAGPKLVWGGRDPGVPGYFADRSLSNLPASYAFIGTIDVTANPNDQKGYINSTTDGMITYFSTESTIGFVAHTVYLGGRNGAGGMSGDVGELGFIDGIISSADRSLLMSYLGTKYGITIS